MKKRFWMAAGILTIVSGMLLSCGRKDEQEELLLFPAGEDMAAGQTPEPEISGDDGRELESAAEEKDSQEIYVIHICGAVKSPGVYLLAEGSRVYQAVEAAGGFAEDADEAYLNQADRLTDGMQLYVPTGEETAGLDRVGQAGNIETAGAENTLVNINTAGEELLCTLPGVGSSKARSIIAYREENGAFQKTEDIMKVEGIKDGLFRKIKDSITV